MNENELRTMVRESVADIHSATPVGQIISRGRAVRARRWVPGAAGALAVAAGAALAVTALLPAGHPGLSATSHGSSHPASAKLAAWTVSKQANGDIDVTIHQLRDPAGLQATLRADGLPVSVQFSGSLLSSACQAYQTTSQDALSAVTRIHGDDLIIDPSALPSGVGLAIFDDPGAGIPHPSPNTPTHGHPQHFSIPPLLIKLNGPLAVGLVYASQQCTG
jgi:hypothetical protein